MNHRRQAGYFPAFAIAEVELGLGHTEASLDWLEHAAEERHMGYYLPSADPIYRSLHTNPRFRALTQQMHTRTSSY